MRDDRLINIPSHFGDSVRIGYACVDTWARDSQMQLDAPSKHALPRDPRGDSQILRRPAAVASR